MNTLLTRRLVLLAAVGIVSRKVTEKTIPRLHNDSEFTAPGYADPPTSIVKKKKLKGGESSPGPYMSPTFHGYPVLENPDNPLLKDLADPAMHSRFCMCRGCDDTY